MKKEKKKPINQKNKSFRFISPIHHFLLVTSSITISMLFIVSWILSISLYKSSVEDFLKAVSETLQTKGYDFIVNFAAFTIVTLIFALFALLVVATPFIFVHKKNFVTLMTSIFSILYALVLLITFSGLIYICYDTISAYIKNGSNIILLFLLPWSLEAFFALILLSSAIWLLITFLFKAKPKTKTSKNKEKSEINNPIIEEQPIAIEPKVEARTEPQNMQTYEHAQQTYSAPLNSQTSPIHQPISSHAQTPIIINNQTPDKNDTTKTESKSGQPVIPEIKIFINNSENKDKVSYSPADAQTTIKNVEYTIPKEQASPTEVISNPIIWSEEEIELIWNKSEVVAGYDYKLYRKDYAGALMFRKAFVNNPTVETERNPKSYNWTIAIQKPVTHGGLVDESNLLAMNTLNAIEKGNHYPRWKTIITYNGRENIVKEKQWKDN